MLTSGARSDVNPPPLDSITSVGNVDLASDFQPPLLGEVPVPTGLNRFVQDRSALLRLGKALFWDMQVGSDGVQSCASCHFHGGADNRIKNQVSPGLKVTPVPDTTFQLGGGPNYTLQASDFPLSTDRVQNDVVSSQGVFSGEPVDSSGFSVGGVNVRRVEPRNAPTVINSGFYRFQFWDGRAKDIFNGVTPFGPNPSGSYPTVFQAECPDSDWSVFDVIQEGGLVDASLASIAVGPVLSLFEMTSFQRTFPDLHFSFQTSVQMVEMAAPLAGQLVDPSDSVLGSLSAYPHPGLSIPSYGAMVQDAFQPQWWNSNHPQSGLTLLEENLSLFWGLAIREYLSTLVADSGLTAHTPFDRYQAGDTNALTTRQVEGLRLFVNTTAQGGANCSTCHAVPEFTRASTRRTLAQENLANKSIAHDLMVKQNGWITDYGVRRPGDDPGAGDPATFPNPSAGSDTGSTLPNTFKTPTLRNIALTAPYMHNGRFSTLEQVVQFYNDGRFDGITNRGPRLSLSQSQQDALVDFLRFGLTDDRVLFERAPFDHPQLFIPNGERGDAAALVTDVNGLAMDQLLEIPAVGSGGGLVPVSSSNFEVQIGALEDPYGTRVTVVGAPSFVYNGTAQGPAHVHVSGSTGTVTLVYASPDGRSYPPGDQAPANVGTYTVTASVAADDLHPSASSPPFPFAILPAPSTIAINDVSTFWSDGENHGPAQAVVTGSSGAVTFIYASADATSYPPSPVPPFQPGAYLVKAIVAADANFAGATSDWFTFTILSAPIENADVPIMPFWGLMGLFIGFLGLGGRPMRHL